MIRGRETKGSVWIALFHEERRMELIGSHCKAEAKSRASGVPSTTGWGLEKTDLEPYDRKYKIQSLERVVQVCLLGLQICQSGIPMLMVCMRAS